MSNKGHNYDPTHLCRRETRSLLTLRLPSTMPVRGLLNQYENSFIYIHMHSQC